MGTGLVESLTSYTSRLAAAHNLSPAVLLGRVLAPLMEKKYWLQGGARPGTRGSALSNSFIAHAKSINGTGVIARNWVSVLETLTMRQDLGFLTMLPWANVLPRRNLFRPTRAWCPSCYQGWRTNDQAVYDPLLWTLREAKVCLRHRRYLRTACQHCGKSLSWLARCARPGHCSKCDRWLGADLENKISEGILADSDWAWQQWVVNNLEELIASGTFLSPLPRERISKAVSLCIDQVSGGVMNKFACLIAKKKNTVWGWQHGTTQIPIDDILRICYLTRISVVDFLHTEFVVPQGTELRTARPSASGVKIRRHPPTTFDRGKNNRTLRAILKETPPPSMKEVAERVNINKRSLYKHSSSLCRAISARHSKYQEACYQEQQNRRAIDVRQATTALQANGIYPSRRRVVALIKERSYRMPEGQPSSRLQPVS